VKPGRRLVYGTCTVSRRRNEEVVSDFLGSNSDFYLIPASDVIPKSLEIHIKGRIFQGNAAYPYHGWFFWGCDATKKYGF